MAKQIQEPEDEKPTNCKWLDRVKKYISSVLWLFSFKTHLMFTLQVFVCHLNKQQFWINKDYKALKRSLDISSIVSFWSGW